MRQARQIVRFVDKHSGDRSRPVILTGDVLDADVEQRWERGHVRLVLRNEDGRYGLAAAPALAAWSEATGHERCRFARASGPAVPWAPRRSASAPSTDSSAIAWADRA